ncbi:hypothetical protein [Brevundimonas sp.]|uniref:hypothetical protein n=1 Tax=Brevundimonas sp. TaxID=1871086 RepID=UPI0028A006FD|nr:hypothetical protein [Brevundimonas sp.]
MDRRLLLFAIPAMALASRAFAAPEAEKPAEAAWVTMTGLALPIVVEDRVINHIFVELKLHLKPGHPLEQVRAKDAAMRDALVRAGHATLFVLPTNYNRINEQALARSLMQIASREVGRGVVTRVEVVRQTPRMRVRNPAPPPRT